MNFAQRFYLKYFCQSHSQGLTRFPSPIAPGFLLIASFFTLGLTLGKGNAQVIIPPTNAPTPSVSQSVSPPTNINSTNANQSTPQIAVNGRTFNGAWFVRDRSNQRQIYISDGALAQIFGVELLSTSTPNRQPIQWYSQPITLPTAIAGGYRYVDITRVVQNWGWQIQTSGNRLIVNTPVTQIQNITPIGSNQALIDLNRPTPWQIRQEPPRKPQGDPDEINKPQTPPNRDWTITLDGITNPTILQRYGPVPAPNPPLPNLLKQLTPNPNPGLPLIEPLIQLVEQVNNQTNIRLSIPSGYVPRITTLANRIQIDVVADAVKNKTITWADGITWRQKMVNLGSERFPVNWLEINPRRSQIRIRPILPNNTTQQGTAPLLETAQRNIAAAAINGGYFNRNNRLPLGAIRSNNEWLSGPILNRGAIAWNNSGQFYFGRLALIEQLTTGNNTTSPNPTIPIPYLNSAYIQSGVSRYTSAWGTSYTSLSNNEVIITVQRNQIIKQTNAAIAGSTSEIIPRDGYLLVIRGNAITTTNNLTPGTPVRLQTGTQPGEFSRYPHIIGAGPLLLQNRQIVLDAEAEKFGKAFATQKAVRSAICNTSSGNIFIVAVHNRAAGVGGPTLQEHAQLMQQLGCVNALNLDGGSSTSLYLGGQLVDRSANTAARVHNGIGIFLQPRK